MAFCLLALQAASASAQEIIDRVMAVVAGDVILLSDVRAAREFGTVDPGKASDPDGEVLSRLIDRALILDEVERYAPPEPPSEAIERALAGVRSRFVSPPAFEGALARAGADERQLRETLRQDLRIRAYLDQRFTADTPEHGRELVAAWLAGLRRRAAIQDFSAAAARP